MNALLSPPPGPVLQAWAVNGRRVEPDGAEHLLFGTTFGRTEERAREVVRLAVQRAMPHGVHVSVNEMRGLPLHPFKPQPFPTP